MIKQSSIGQDQRAGSLHLQVRTSPSNLWYPNCDKEFNCKKSYSTQPKMMLHCFMGQWAVQTLTRWKWTRRDFSENISVLSWSLPAPSCNAWEPSPNSQLENQPRASLSVGEHSRGGIVGIRPYKSPFLLWSISVCNMYDYVCVCIPSVLHFTYISRMHWLNYWC